MALVSAHATFFDWHYSLDHRTLPKCNRCLSLVQKGAPPTCLHKMKTMTSPSKSGTNLI